MILTQRWDWAPASTHIVRSICNPTNQEDDLFENTFTIFANGVPPEDENNSQAIVLISEIQTSNVSNTHMIAATAVQQLVVYGRVPDLENKKDYREFLTETTRWGSRWLWDYTTMYMRSVASGLLVSELRLPDHAVQSTLLSSDGHTPLDG